MRTVMLATLTLVLRSWSDGDARRLPGTDARAAVATDGSPGSPDLGASFPVVLSLGGGAGSAAGLIPGPLGGAAFFGAPGAARGRLER